MNVIEPGVVEKLVEQRLEPLPPSPLPPQPRSGVAITVLATLSVVAALWWGQRFLIPVVAALMLAMLVMPVSIGLQRGLRNAATASVTTLVMVLCSIALAAMVFGGQLLRVADARPR